MKSFFRNPQTVEELRKQYLELLKKFHPDNGGSDDDAKEINAQYDVLFEKLKNIHSAAGKEQRTENFDRKLDAALREALRKLSGLDGIQVEICGSWLWVTGNTFPVKENLKESGFRFSHNKKAWYFHTGEYRRTGKKSYSMEYIRAIHGSEIIEPEKILQLQ